LTSQSIPSDPFENFGDFPEKLEPAQSPPSNLSNEIIQAETFPPTDFRADIEEKPKENLVAVALLTRQETKKLDHLTRSRPKMKRTHTVSKAKPAVDISVTDPISLKSVC
jgi:hypothetical protein